MANPWEKYQTSNEQSPWDKYGGQDEPSTWDKVKDVFTGESKETAATENLPEMYDEKAGGLLAGESPAKVAAITPLIMATTDPQEVADILKENFPNIGIQYDEMGNIIAGNNKSGIKAVINKPGMSKSDVLSMIGLTAVAAPAAITAAGATPLAAAAQVAAQTGLSTAAVEGLQSSTGGEFNPENVAMDTFTAGVLEGVRPAISALRGRASQAATQATEDAAQAEAARVVSPVSPEMSQARTAQATEQMAQQAQVKPSKRDYSFITEGGDVDPEIKAAAEELGVIDKLTPAQLTTDQSLREVEGAVAASKPSTQLSAKRREALDAVAQKADDMIEEFGGTVDTASLSDNIKTDMLSTISSLKKDGSELYNQVNDVIPKRAKVDVTDLKTFVDDAALDVGGIENLTPLEKKMYDLANSEPTYAKLDIERKLVGKQMKNPAFSDADEGQLKKYYSLLTDAQENEAMKHGNAAELWQRAKKHTIQQKRLEESSIALMGRDLSGAIMPKAGSAIKQLSKGDFKNWDNLMKNLPKDQRQAVAVSALNDAFTLGSRKEKQLSPAGFADWYESLSRKQAAKSRLMANLPAGAPKRLESIYQVSKGIRQADAAKFETGVVVEKMKDIESSDGWVSKIYNISKGVAAAEGVSSAVGFPGAGTVGVLATAMAKGKGEPLMEAADAMISSPEFKNYMIQYAGQSVKAKAKQAIAEKALMKTAKYQKWLDSLPSDTKRNVLRSGLTGYLDGQQYTQEDQR